METVFKDRLFESTGTLRFLQSADESWGELVRRQAVALHTAIDCKDSTAVEELFLLGVVHIDMLLGADEGCTIRPLHRAAFTGSAEVLRVLINEMPNTLPNGMKSQILDCLTELEYTPYMLACECGHTEVAQVLVENGCNVALTNSSHRTGKKLADIFQREVELSCVHPWSRADRQHLVATSLESFLDMAKAALNEHVHAGMKVWNSKQMVWKLSKEQMQALQTRIKQLVCGMCAHMSNAHACTCMPKQAEKGTDALACTQERTLAPLHARTPAHAHTCTQSGTCAVLLASMQRCKHRWRRALTSRCTSPT